MKSTRFLALLLSAAVTLPLLTACSDTGVSEETPSADSSPVVSPAETPEASAVEAAEETHFTANVPAGTDYDGYEFPILVYDETNAVWHDSDFNAEELTGDVLNDAVFSRKVTVEDALNMKVRTCPETAYCETPMANSVQSGDGAYDCGFVGLSGTFNLAEKKMLYDLNTVDSLDLHAPWWDENCVEQLSIAHRNYQLTGDISIIYRKSLRVLYYNKALASNYQLADPYTMVDERTWTLDALTSLCKNVSSDLNGDGQRDQDDCYGLVYSSGTAPIVFVASGVRYATKNADDCPEITFYNEKTVDVWTRYSELLFDREYAANCSANGWDYSNMFITDRGLFCCMELHHVEELREMDNDFGILPIPMFDEAQEDYYVTVNVGPAAACVIPVTNTELQRTAYILDSLGAEGKNTVTPAYYEAYLKGKTVRDEESRHSLEIIFHSVLYDIGACYGWGGISDLPYTLVNSYSTDIASAYSSLDKLAKKSLERTMKEYQDN